MVNYVLAIGDYSPETVLKKLKSHFHGYEVRVLNLSYKNLVCISWVWDDISGVYSDE